MARPRSHPRQHTAPAPAAHRSPATTPPGGPGPAAYLATVIHRSAAHLAAMNDGRQRALSALAYHAGGILDWSGLTREQVVSQLIDAGIASGLGPGLTTSIVRRAIANGIDRPISPPRTS